MSNEAHYGYFINRLRAVLQQDPIPYSGEAEPETNYYAEVELGFLSTYARAKTGSDRIAVKLDSGHGYVGRDSERLFHKLPRRQAEPV